MICIKQLCLPNERIAVALYSHCWFKYFNSAQWNKNSITADSIRDASKL